MLDIKFLGKVTIEYDGLDITDKFSAKTTQIGRASCRERV